ncbi:hypothetical protein CIPAW_08G049900 [Carya illinoinensis]|uniref:Uncharacterized protein n=1 Tax=Carya illinoinensis TaxID=32201 RepID=A0A8T1PIU8_CARIL|nr:hypothetical protein CIPAW_08G049900 [Carya illinoinensis]
MGSSWDISFFTVTYSRSHCAGRYNRIPDPPCEGLGWSWGCSRVRHTARTFWEWQV